MAEYADDPCVFSVKANRKYAILAITHHFQLPTTWFKKWRIAVTINKTQAFSFCNLIQEPLDTVKIKFTDTELLWSSNCKYLAIKSRQLPDGDFVERSVVEKLVPMGSRKCIHVCLNMWTTTLPDATDEHL